MKLSNLAEIKQVAKFCIAYMLDLLIFVLLICISVRRLGSQDFYSHIGSKLEIKI